MFYDFYRFKVTYSLIGLNILFYLFLVIKTGKTQEMSADILVDYGALYAPLVFTDGEWWRVGTAIFLHGGALHLAMNMISLFIVGRPAELCFSAKEYLALYFLSALAGATASIAVHPDTVNIGASGAIFGIFGALFGYLFFHPKGTIRRSDALLKDFGVIIGINLILGFGIPGIDMSAHITGLLAGIIGGIFITRYPKRLPLFVVGMLVAGAGFYLYLSTLFIRNAIG